MFFNKKLCIGRATVLVTPGDSVHVSFDPYESDISATRFSGSNALGHQEFHKVFNTPVLFYQPTFSWLQNLPQTQDSLVHLTSHYIDEQMEPYNKLLNEGKISAPFYTSINKTLNLSLTHNLVRRIADPVYPGIMSMDRALRIAIMDSLLSRVGPNDNSLRDCILFILFAKLIIFSMSTYPAYIQPDACSVSVPKIQTV